MKALTMSLPTILFALIFVSYSLGREAMKVEAPFKEGQDIPLKYTCDGEDISPQIRWSGQPSNTRSFVMVMDDPDAPGGTFTQTCGLWWSLSTSRVYSQVLHKGVCP